MNKLKEEITRVLLYFDIFSFPLRKEEIHRYCRVKVSPSAISLALQDLVTTNKVYQFQEYFLVRPKESWIKLRHQKREHSTKKMEKAIRNAKLISRFPFVEGVAISGSLSKYASNEDDDIDYFIITNANRLWICRSMLHFFKKFTYLFGKQHDFCMNYFLDKKELELKDKNIYTAIESITILPLFGTNTYQAFYKANPWLKDFFPNFDFENTLITNARERKYLAKSFFEKMLIGKAGTWLNQGIQLFTVWWWRHKFRWSGFPMEHFDMDLRSTEGESKYHPNDYQRFILEAFAKRIQAFQNGQHYPVFLSSHSKKLGS